MTAATDRRAQHPATEQPPAGRSGKSIMDKIGAQNLSLLVALALLVLYFASRDSVFYSWPNLMNIGDSIAVIGLLAMGETFVILSGALDISVGAIAAVTGVVAGTLMINGWSSPIGIVGGLLAGFLLGMFNGFCVNTLKVNPVITTLGTLQLFTGLAFFIAPNARPVDVRNSSFTILGTGRLFRTDSFPGIPYSLIFMLAVCAAAIVVLRATTFGRAVYALGGNEKAAHLSGINVKRVKTMLFALSGLLAGAGGLLIAARTGSATAETANAGFELRAITAVFLGGAATTGGKGTMVGTLLAVVLVGALNNGMNLIGWSTYWQFVALGMLLIGAVAVGEWRKSRDERSLMGRSAAAG